MDELLGEGCPVLNLVLICLDTFHRDCVGALGDNTFKTPNLDRLCEDGIVFENALGEARPTIQFRRGLLTGMRAFPWRHDYNTRGLWPSIRGWHKACPEHDTLSEIQLGNGHTTRFFSDTHHIFMPTMNFTRGYTSREFIRGQESDNYRSDPLEAVDLGGYLPPGLHDAVREGGRATLLQYLLNNQDRKAEKDYPLARAFAVGAVAAGIPVSRQRLHRSVRALLTHRGGGPTALTLSAWRRSVLPYKSEQCLPEADGFPGIVRTFAN